jgi:hypothetical protein
MDVHEFLLGDEADPSIRWQAMRDLTDSSTDAVAAERARVATEGWGARLLALQGDDGLWDGGVYNPSWRTPEYRATHPGQPWTGTMHVLKLLFELGVAPESPAMQHAIALVRDNARWDDNDLPFFDGDIEECTNGCVLALGSQYGQRVDDVVAWILDAQLADGGWNCDRQTGSTRSSFHSVICVLEGLIAHEDATGGTEATREARRRGEEYLLERALMRRKSDGELVDPGFLQFSFPTRWWYDVLRALDYFRSAAAPGAAPDPRLDEALHLVRDKHRPDGTWALENTHIGEVPFPLEGADGEPSRWNTLRALRVLRWAGDEVALG